MAVQYALVTGAFIAAYTLWDKQAVSRFAMSPILLDWGANLGRALLLTPFALSHWHETRVEWQTHRREAAGVALLAPLSYILVLTALAVHSCDLCGAGAGDQHSDRHGDGDPLACGRRRAPPLGCRRRDGSGRSGAGGRIIDRSKRSSRSKTFQSFQEQEQGTMAS